MFRILVVDDTKSVHAFVGDILSKVNGIEHSRAFNGQEALQKLKVDPKFDLVLLDWEMPILDGPATLAEIKSLGILTPVIMMTTKNSLDDVKRMLAIGSAEYMMKPFDAEILFDKIDFVTGKRFSYAS